MIDIREIRQHQLPDLLYLYEHLHDADEPLPPSEIISSVWEEIQNNKNIKYFGLFDTGNLVSSCNITLVPNLTRSCRPYGLIENVVTHADHRNLGYGKKILRATISYAWERQCYKVMLMTGRLNEKTFRFYESVGFNRNSKQAFIIKSEN